MNLTNLSDELFRELEEPTDCSIPAIAFWLSSNIGGLNNLIGSGYEVANGVLTTEMSASHASIFKTQYKVHYTDRKINQNLGAAAYTSIMEVKEGNRTVKRTNKNNIAQTYIALRKELVASLKDQVADLRFTDGSMAPEDYYVPNPIHTELPETHSTRSTYRGF